MQRHRFFCLLAVLSLGAQGRTQTPIAAVAPKPASPASADVDVYKLYPSMEPVTGLRVHLAQNATTLAWILKHPGERLQAKAFSVTDKDSGAVVPVQSIDYPDSRLDINGNPTGKVDASFALLGLVSQPTRVKTIHLVVS